MHRYLQWWARAFSFLLVELFVLFNTTLALRYRAILQKYKRLGSYCATADLGCPGPFLLLKYDKWRVPLFLFYYFNKELISYSGLNIIFGGLLFLSLELYMNQIPKKTVFQKTKNLDWQVGPSKPLSHPLPRGQTVNPSVENVSTLPIQGAP